MFVIVLGWSVHGEGEEDFGEGFEDSNACVAVKVGEVGEGFVGVVAG